MAYSHLTTPKPSLERYAAFATAFLGSAAAVDGAVVYTDLDPDEVVVASTFGVDMDNDGTPEFQVFHGSYSGYFTARIYANDSGDNLGTNYGFYAMPVPGGSPINSSIMMGQNGTIGLYAPYKGTFGAFTGTAFIPVSFDIGPNTHYGWIRLSTPSNYSNLTVLDYAYEDVPGASIDAGEGIAGVVCNAPTGLNSTTSVTVAWTAITDADFYRLRGRLAGTTTFQNVVINAASGPNRTVSGLTSGASYEWTVQARCPDGSGGFIVTPEAALESFTLPSPRLETPIEDWSIQVLEGQLTVDAQGILMERVQVIDLNGRVLHAWAGEMDFVQGRLKEGLSGEVLVRIRTADGWKPAKAIFLR